MNPLLAQITLLLVLVVIFCPPRWAVLGVVSGVCYVTEGQLFSIGGINFSPIRFIIIVGFIRVIFFRKEFSFSEFNKIDKSLLIFSLVCLLVHILRSQLISSTKSTYTYQLAKFFESLMSYFIFRGFVNDSTSFRQFSKDLALLIFPFTIFMVIEGVTGRNLFSVMGGVPETPWLREGYYRCQGSFRHAITAGSFGATLVPFFIALGVIKDSRFLAVGGILLGVSITILSHSSGPVMALMAGIIAWMFWYLREKMRVVRWAIFVSLVFLHMVMKAPVWFIYARLSDVIGGHGWFRANLIDKFVNNFQEWWLIGMPIEKTYTWAATQMSWGAVDVTNEYVSVGIGGGLISLILFILVLKNCFQFLGIAMENIRFGNNKAISDEALLWGLGCALFSHVINLSSSNYFDQFWVMWYMLLAVISSVTHYYIRQFSINSENNLA